MKFYLSSFRVWDEENSKKLIELVSKTNKRVAYINNALDWFTDEKKKEIDNRNFNDFEQFWLEIEQLNLIEYFGNQAELEKRLQSYDIIWVTGWNVFVLMQAFHLSWFNNIIKEYILSNADKLYWWYSAWGCVLWPTLAGYAIVDDSDSKPYWEQYDTIREWLGVLDYCIAPHFQSNHHESEGILKEIELMKEKWIPYKALRDWEVIIID